MIQSFRTKKVLANTAQGLHCLLFNLNHLEVLHYGRNLEFFQVGGGGVTSYINEYGDVRAL